jgi:EpsI family protein
MKKPFVASLTLGFLMVLSSGLAWVMTPTMQVAVQRDKVNLESIIPDKFGGWRVAPSVAVIVNPEAQETINKIYSQTLSRSYINGEGERVMLSIAYGGNQSTDMHVHRPEQCYAVSGFEIGKMTKAFVDTKIGRIPVMRLVAKRGAHNEPITYWIRVGDSITRGWFEQKLAAIGYAFTGKVPDGLLFRVSSISNDEQDSYRIQQNFLDALLQAVRSEDRFRLVGQMAH